MFRESRTFRWLLTALLALSTSVAGLAPRIAGGARAAAGQSVAESPSPACCCGTTTGNCCRAGVCNSRNGQLPERSPLPARDRLPSLVLALVGGPWSAPAAMIEGHLWHAANGSLDRSLADATLQALHVRLDA